MRNQLLTSALLGLALIASPAVADDQTTQGAEEIRIALAAALPLGAALPAVKTAADENDVPGFGPILVVDKPKATTATTTTTLSCAARDVELITSIDDHGSVNDVSSDRLADAAFGMLNARSVCGAGRETEALALYDRALQGLARQQAQR